MRPLPLVVILIVSLFGGRLIGSRWSEPTTTEDPAARLEVEREKIREIAAEKAAELVDGYFEQRRERLAKEDSELDERRMAAITTAQTRVDTMAQIVERTQETLDRLAKSQQLDLKPGEYVVARATVGKLQDDLVYGKILLGASESQVRREGLRRVARAAGEGRAEAIEVLMGLFSDSDPAIAQEALRLATALARRDDAERRQLLADSGLEARLVAMLPGLEGSAQRRVLDALTIQGNQAAVTYWRQMYNDDSSRNRDQVSAARALKDLGSPGEFDQLLLQLEYDLGSDDRRVMRSALNDIRRLGGDQAKAALQRALDAAPDGPDADMLRRTLERFDRQDQQRVRFGGSDAEAVPPAFFGGEDGGQRRGRRQRE